MGRHGMSHGFSMLEVTTLIAILGVMATILVTMVGRQPVIVRETKLSSDVATLNSCVAMYLADGGNLTGVTNPQTVIDRLKKPRAQGEWQRHTGASSGRLVDTRLKARITSSVPRDGSRRARWNPQVFRFEMSSASGNAVTEFYFDDALQSLDPGVDTTRKGSVVKYNGNNRGWVWADSSASSMAYAPPGETTGMGNTVPFNPDEDAATSPPPTGGGGSGGTGGTGGSGGTTGGGTGVPSPTRLPRPSITPSGGTFAYAAFPSSVTFNANGAPAGDASQLQYRVNGGGWVVYQNSPVPLSPADLVEARNVALDTLTYSDSSTAQGRYYRLVETFTGTSTGTWGNAGGGSNLFVDVQNSTNASTFKHGNTKLDLGNGEYLDAGTENVLTFTRAPFESIQPNTWFNLGDMLMLNGTTFYDSEAGSVTLSLNLSISSPPQTGVVHVDLGLISTENTSDRLASADIVELRNPSTDFTVTIDGVIYRLELSWVTLDPGAGVVQGNQFLIYEGSTARAELRARFKSNQ
jgi:type II secretory pathway pseudopilin PulG